MSGITRWLCGGCGAVHGYECPYWPLGPVANHALSPAQCQAIRQRIDADRKAGRWPFPISEEDRKLFDIEEQHK